ncbi:MAG: PHB depolymerase family esterase [Cyanobacteriota bacterium]
MFLNNKLVIFTFVLILIVLLINPSSLFSEDNNKIIQYKSGDKKHLLNHDGQERKYVVHLPDNYSKLKIKFPVVIYVHGGGGSIKAAYADGIDKMSDKYGFILAIPNSTKVKHGPMGNCWNGGRWKGGECCGSADDVGFISKMIDEIKQNYNVDDKRIYAMGISNGGLMTNRLACELSDKIAAIATVAPAAILENCHPKKHVPIMNIHGTLDPCNPFDGSVPKNFCARVPYKRMSPEEVVNTWKKINGCTNKSVNYYSKGKASCQIYNQCKDNSEVVFCIDKGMGHTWPGGAQYFPAFLVGPVSKDITTEQIWNFLKKHKL